MYNNTFKNELATNQNGKLLLNTCSILFYCRNGAKINVTAIKRICKLYRVHYYVFILFDFILNIPVNNFSIMSAH